MSFTFSCLSLYICWKTKSYVWSTWEVLPEDWAERQQVLCFYSVIWFCCCYCVFIVGIKGFRKHSFIFPFLVKKQATFPHHIYILCFYYYFKLLLLLFACTFLFFGSNLFLTQQDFLSSHRAINFFLSSPHFCLVFFFFFFLGIWSYFSNLFPSVKFWYFSHYLCPLFPHDYEWWFNKLLFLAECMFSRTSASFSVNCRLGLLRKIIRNGTGQLASSWRHEVELFPQILEALMWGPTSMVLWELSSESCLSPYSQKIHKNPKFQENFCSLVMELWFLLNFIFLVVFDTKLELKIYSALPEPSWV